MKLPPFKLEQFWQKYEFKTPYLLCASDAESWKLNEILALADPESRKLWDTLSLGYTEVEGMPLLREEIARLYPGLDKDQVMTFAGGEEGIYWAMHALVAPKDHVIVVTPCYQSLFELPKALGADVTMVSLDPKKQWKLDIEELRKAFRPTTKVIILNEPHNPTGALMEGDVFREMIHLAREKGVYIFSDEMYRFLEFDEKDRQPSMAEAYEKGISLFGMTKPFGLAGLRIGWLASQDKAFLRKAINYKVYTSICNSAPSEILSIIALRAKDKILERNFQVVRKNLEILDRFFERHSTKVSWVRPKAGTIAFPELKLPIPIDQFSEELIKQKGVLIMPGTIFDAPGNFFRIGFGRKNMPEALNLFEQFLEAF